MAERTRVGEMNCELSNLPVYYEVIGEGKPILMIPGIPSDHQIIKSWMEPIFASRTGWQRIYFTCPAPDERPPQVDFKAVMNRKENPQGYDS
jgi:hypothetical protein